MEYEEIEARHNALEMLGSKALSCASEEEAMDLLEAIKLIRAAGESSVLDVIHWHVIARLRELSSENAAALRTEGVYAIHFENGIVKIGRTKKLSAAQKHAVAAIAFKRRGRQVLPV